MGYCAEKVAVGLDRFFADLPFRWGVNDCCLAPANVLEALGDDRLKLRLQSEYSDKATALGWIDRGGGFVPLAQRVLNELGYQPTTTNRPGCLAIVVARYGPSLALGDGNRFWGKAIRGAHLTGEALHIWE